MQNETVQQTTEKELTFRTMFTVLKKHAIWISILAIIGAIAVGVLTAVLVPVKYVGKTTFFVNNVSEHGDYIQSTMVSASGALAGNYTQIVTQKITLKEAIKASKLDVFLGLDEYDAMVYLRSHITTTHNEESMMFDIIVTDTNPDRTLAISQALYDVLPGVIADLNTKLAESEKENDYIQATEWVETSDEITIKNPPVVTNALITAVAVFVLFYAIALLFAMLDTIVYNEENLKENFTYPVIGSLPSWNSTGKRARRTLFGKLSGKKRVLGRDGRITRDYTDKILCENTPFAIQEAFKHIRTNISYSKTTEGTPVYVITSSIAGAGKSTIASNLAITFAVAGKRTLLVETDMRCPSFANILGLDSDAQGLSELLADIVKNPDDVIIRNFRENLDVVVSGHIPPNPSELLGQDRLRELLEKWRDEYDIILMDAPPFGEVSDAGVFASYVDGYVVVVRSEYSDINNIRSAIASLTTLNTPIVGFILNDVQPKRGKKYGYGYAYSAQERTTENQ